MAIYARSLFVAGALSIAPLAAHAAVISNGFFSSSCGSGSFCTYNAGDASIPGWTIGSGSVDLITGYWQAPLGGGNSINLDGLFQAADINTSMSTIAGHQYTVTFELSGNPDGDSPIKATRVSAAGFYDDYTFDTSTGNSHGNMMWAAKTFTFTANGAFTTLDFQSLDAANSAWGPTIGDITANDEGAHVAGSRNVPEPASFVLFGSGLLAFGFLRRRELKRA